MGKPIELHHTIREQLTRQIRKELIAGEFEEGEQEDDIPLPLDKAEIDGFVRCGLIQESFAAYDDTQDPPVPHFFASYRK